MPYIDYDENGNITTQFACNQYNGQLYTNIVDLTTYKVINGEVIDISQTPEYVAEQKKSKETQLFTEARECVEKLLTYKLLYPAQAQTYQDAIDARYAKLDADLLGIDGE